MQERESELVDFLRTLHAAIAERAAAGSPARSVTEKIFAALRLPRSSATPAPARRPVCALLEPVLEGLLAPRGSARRMERGGACALEHARAVAALSERLSWRPRAGAERVGEPFASGHANATVVGKGGLEERDDVWIGISLMAPHIDYPEHRHAPEEVYLALSPGHWQQEGGSWHQPGMGGIVHNPPHVRHAMRSGPMPLLTTWCLWVGD